METKGSESAKRHLPNRLGIKGWVWGGRYTWERYLYTLHRVTGLGLLLYVMLHLVANGFRLGGEESWGDVMGVLGGGGFKFGEYVVMVAFGFHALNGGRLILQHLGYTLGKPKPPIYPYVDSMRRHRSVVWLAMALTVVFAIWVLIEFVV